MKLCDVVQDLVRAATGSSRGWICALKWGILEGGENRDIVRAAINYWSPLKFTATCRPLGITDVYYLKAHLEMVTLSLPWSPLEVGAS